MKACRMHTHLKRSCNLLCALSQSLELLAKGGQRYGQSLPVWSITARASAGLGRSFTYRVYQISAHVTGCCCNSLLKVLRMQVILHMSFLGPSIVGFLELCLAASSTFAVQTAELRRILEIKSAFRSSARSESGQTAFTRFQLKNTSL